MAKGGMGAKSLRTPGLYAAREFGSGLEGNAIQHYPKLKMFQEQIINKIAVSEASAEQIHSPLRPSLGNDQVTNFLLIIISTQYIETETTDNTDKIRPLYEDY